MAASKELLGLITQVAAHLGVPPQIALAVAQQESNFNQGARGSSGEIGMFQIMPLWSRIARTKGWDISTVEGNVMMGVWILADSIRAEGGNIRNALRRYNGGPSWARKPVTEGYASSVLSKAAALSNNGLTKLPAGASGVYPVPGGKLMSEFGDPRDGGARKHEGIDIGAPAGTPIRAFRGGRVVKVNYKDTGLGGRTVTILADDGRQYYYAHMQDVGVQLGQTIRGGQNIGTVGNTGNARTTPPHLHFGIYENGKAIDPERVMSNVEMAYSTPVTGVRKGRKPRFVETQATIDEFRLGWQADGDDGDPETRMADAEAAFGRSLAETLRLDEAEVAPIVSQLRDALVATMRARAQAAVEQGDRLGDSVLESMRSRAPKVAPRFAGSSLLPTMTLDDDQEAPVGQ